MKEGWRVTTSRTQEAKEAPEIEAHWGDCKTEQRPIAHARDAAVWL